MLRIDGGACSSTGEPVVAEGACSTARPSQAAMDEARAGLAVQLEAFAGNTMDYLRRERDLLLDGVGVPDITTDLDGRQVLIVVRGYHYKEDLATLRPYIREYRPVLIGVDGGADALLEAGYTPGPHRRRHGLGLRPGAALRRRDRRARLPRRPRPRPGAGRALGRRARRLPRHGHQRGRRDAARRRQGRRAHRRGRHARHPRGVPRQGPLRHGQHVPHPAAGRRQARRRQGRVPALPARGSPACPLVAHAARRARSPSVAALVATDGGRAAARRCLAAAVGRPLASGIWRTARRDRLPLPHRLAHLGLPRARRRHRARRRAARGRDRQPPDRARSPRCAQEKDDLQRRARAQSENEQQDSDLAAAPQPGAARGSAPDRRVARRHPPRRRRRTSASAVGAAAGRGRRGRSTVDDVGLAGLGEHRRGRRRARRRPPSSRRGTAPG